MPVGGRGGPVGRGCVGEGFGCGVGLAMPA